VAGALGKGGASHATDEKLGPEENMDRTLIPRAKDVFGQIECSRAEWVLTL
jgi:hypothetical protein